MALKIEQPRSSIDSTASLEGMSNVRHPMLLEAVLRFKPMRAARCCLPMAR